MRKIREILRLHHEGLATRAIASSVAASHTRVTKPYGQAIEYRYDAAGNREQLIAPHGTVSYTFDELNRISTVTDQGGRVTRYEYDLASRLKRTEYGNGTEAVYTYDALSRLKELTNRKIGGAVITGHKYTLDPAGHRTRIEERIARSIMVTTNCIGWCRSIGPAGWLMMPPTLTTQWVTVLRKRGPMGASRTIMMKMTGS